MKLYRIEFYDLRDVFHDANVLADSPEEAIAVLRQHFSTVRISVLFELNVAYSDPVDYAEERSLALNAYKYGFFPQIKNR